MWVVERNLEARAEGMLALPPCTIHLLGQSALLEVGARLTLAVTNDVDVRADYAHAIEVELRRLLKRVGKELDPSGPRDLDAQRPGTGGGCATAQCSFWPGCGGAT